MLFKVFVAIATSSFALGVRAAPAQNLTERQGGGVYITTDLNWGGATAYLPATGYYNCLRIPEAFLGQVSSIGPDPGVSVSSSSGTLRYLGCTLMKAQCSGLLNYDSCGDVDGHPTIGIGYPGISTEDGWVHTTAGEGIVSWNDAIVGLDCINENAPHGE
ncbi:hypothetical protein EXIGLDRAFT_755917 [Exidia glandulosa HHB12029]|uniref:Uncharacterized protein n=1 Tax=Exidia glandulosa HHB12029 TaxID=1314781 RepID=A0A165BNJ8_EXIGL|nr:hypothetical protein EXIGLDRAFT_755917 [Exidia glandulosa HHB12029]